MVVAGLLTDGRLQKKQHGAIFSLTLSFRYDSDYSVSGADHTLNREPRENRGRARRCNLAPFGKIKGNLFSHERHCFVQAQREGC